MSGTGAQPPIIKKIKKGGHGGAHGGSWKVAYADFVTAMMAFFLLLWLISMVSDEKKAQVSQYFKNFSVFDQSGNNFLMDKTDAGSQIEIIKTGETGNKGSETEDTIKYSGADAAFPGNSPVDKIKEKMKAEIEQKLAGMKDQVLIDIYEGAVRIEIVDKKDGKSMFNSGSKEMTAEGKMALRVIAESLGDVQGKIALEGHTDATTYSGSNYSNWELSTERASAARRELENSGMSPDRLIRVAGYAASEPLIKEDPYDPKNRRISIKVFPTDNQPLPDGLTSGAQETSRTGETEGITPSLTEPVEVVDPIDAYLLKK